MRFVYYAKSIELRVVNYIMLSRAYARDPVTYRDAQSGPVGPIRLGPSNNALCPSRGILGLC